jgi:hypothetical protein
MVDKGLSERRSLAIVGMSASAYRYETLPDGNEELRQRIMALAQRHKRYGVGMIYLKLRQAVRLFIDKGSDGDLLGCARAIKQNAFPCGKAFLG